jgi:hypothetical protein
MVVEHSDEREPQSPAAPAAPRPRDVAYWAKPVTTLRADQRPVDGVNINVTGRRVVGPLQGFGKMWEKTYQARLSGGSVTPTALISAWKEHFPSFWPPGNRFYAPLTGIRPGEVAVLNLSMAPMVRLSTGVMVLYADDESFTLMTPEGHVFAGWITFSAFSDDGTTVIQTKVLMRANDPIYEIGLDFFGGHRREDRFWEHTLRAVARHFNIDTQVETRVSCIDPSRRWKNAANVRHNALVRSAIYDAGRPFRFIYRRVRRTG